MRARRFHCNDMYTQMISAMCARAGCGRIHSALCWLRLRHIKSLFVKLQQPFECGHDNGEAYGLSVGTCSRFTMVMELHRGKSARSLLYISANADDLYKSWIAPKKVNFSHWPSIDDVIGTTSTMSGNTFRTPVYFQTNIERVYAIVPPLFGMENGWWDRVPVHTFTVSESLWAWKTAPAVYWGKTP